MNGSKTLFSLIILSLTFGAFAKQGPQYANDDTEEVISKMIDAHGGMDRWNEAETFSFQNIMFSASLGKQPFWINDVTVDTKTRRVYQDWLSHDATMAYDGKETWSYDWKVGNAPKFEALFFYYFLNLPWLTQDDNVVLGQANKINHDAFENEVYVVDMGFSKSPAIGKTEKDTYKLYIDAESFILVGYEYSIGYGYMLDLFGFPPEKELFGPMFRVNDAFVEVDGLIYPRLMHTGNVEMTQVYGNHAIVNYSLDKTFNKSWMKKTPDAVIDESSDQRKQK